MSKKTSSDSFLENYYSGDADWKQYVFMCQEEYPNFEREQTQLLNLLENQYDIAIVVFQRTGENSTDWVKQKIPALNGLSAIACLTEPHLTNRLKECLLRMD